MLRNSQQLLLSVRQTPLKSEVDLRAQLQLLQLLLRLLGVAVDRHAGPEGLEDRHRAAVWLGWVCSGLAWLGVQWLAVREPAGLR